MSEEPMIPEEMPEEKDQIMPEDRQKAEPEDQPVTESVGRERERDRLRSPPARDEKAQAFRSYNMAWQLDGMGPGGIDGRYLQ